MADLETSTNESNQESKNIIYLWKIPIDQDYVKSLQSILRVVAAFLSLIAFICVASGRSEGCDDDYASSYNFFEFITITCFLSILIMWLFFAVALYTKAVFRVVPWKFAYMIQTAVLAVLYLIANICVAAQSCGKGSNKAGVAFGFFAMACMVVDGVFSFREWRSTGFDRADNKATASKSPEYNPDRNMEQY